MSPTGRYARLLLPAALVVVADQIVKQWALAALRDGPIDLVPGALTLRLTFNSGGAFGIFQGRPAVFLVAALAVSGAIVVGARRVQDPALVIALGVILGGGLGNAVDRLARDHAGKVVDLIDLHVWPVFNLADSAIVLGVLAVLILGVRERSSDEPQEGLPRGAPPETEPRSGARTEG